MPRPSSAYPTTSSLSLIATASRKLDGDTPERLRKLGYVARIARIECVMEQSFVDRRIDKLAHRRRFAILTQKLIKLDMRNIPRPNG